MKVGFTAIIGLLFAALGVGVPVAWDWYTTRSGLELQYLGATMLNPRFGAFDKLQIVYDGQPIKSVSNLEFAFVNTGRRPILEDMLVAAPKITFADEAKILDVRISDTSAPTQSEGSRGLEICKCFQRPGV